MSTKLPPHLVTEVGWWVSYGAAPTPVGAAQFCLGALADKTLASRLSCINALNEWFEVYCKQPSPFRANPYPYPLLRKVLVWSWSDVTAWLGGLRGPERAWGVLMALTRASAQDVVEWRPESTSGGLVRVGDRVVPVTDEALRWLEGYTRPKSTLVTRILPQGIRVTDLHNALFAELHRRGVPEVTVAGVYGRWSAMALQPAVGPVTYFRVAVL